VLEVVVKVLVLAHKKGVETVLALAHKKGLGIVHEMAAAVEWL
jgi:hypothetical protein